MSVVRHQWLTEPIPPDVEKALERLAQTDDVVALAVMPDVHLAHDVCVGTVTATTVRVLPDAVGGDIGCGMQALAFDGEADRVDDPDCAAEMLARLYAAVPILKHRSRDAPALAADLAEAELSAPTLERRKAREAPRQLGTVGRGNHFVELQRDDEGRLWAMVHTGSRGMGPAIREHHRRRAPTDPASGLPTLSAGTPAGQAYLQDAAWARGYAEANRDRIMTCVVDALAEVAGVRPMEETRLDADHNHVQREEHRGRALWVHRKGAQRADDGALGIVPGSMGEPSFHVRGRGHPEALSSSAHGAGRAMSRSEARRRISRRQLARDTVGVWYDQRLADRLREEAPAAYKDIGAVMRAQRPLVRVVRRLRPVLVYKGV